MDQIVCAVYGIDYPGSSITILNQTLLLTKEVVRWKRLMNQITNQALAGGVQMGDNITFSFCLERNIRHISGQDHFTGLSGRTASDFQTVGEKGPCHTTLPLPLVRVLKTSRLIMVANVKIEASAAAVPYPSFIISV
ncbi:hypothetical protein SDC9_146007 [bioreactor metagenome]|uniref:Uncharacterized protein n=1 Tax=bioreactor metagenome TaxID=1076179 RepID=A0A645EA47_9ZZZZ